MEFKKQRKTKKKATFITVHMNIEQGEEAFNFSSIVVN
jgi:hypothetical protein